MRFSGMAFSMAGSIGFCVWLGRQWDQSSDQSIPLGTLFGGVLGTVLAIWLVVKELSK
ncbi:AtpZ/AtpI family protein [Flavobacteriales bacterium]|nr:AtpZ/AtpI family protein [Flavobacteriales bacterium]